jgi:hypothetical protein
MCQLRRYGIASRQENDLLFIVLLWVALPEHVHLVIRLFARLAFKHFFTPLSRGFFNETCFYIKSLENVTICHIYKIDKPAGKIG